VPGFVDYPAFIAAVLVFLMVPGPGTLAVLNAAARGGPRGGRHADRLRRAAVDGLTT